MFTIKHVSPEGYESLYEAIEVNFKPEPPGVGNTVWYTCPGTKEIKSIDNGWAYVTNETGATVAKYNLANSRVGVSNTKAPLTAQEEFNRRQTIRYAGQIGGEVPDEFPVSHFMKPDDRIG